MSDTAGPAQRQRPAAAEVIEDIHPLSPLQQGLLFHTLREADSAVYLSQTTALLSGLDPVAFRESWEQTVAWHPALRSAFLWEGADEPVQVVYRRVPVRFDTQDWRGLPPDAMRQRLTAFLDRDRNEPFQLSHAPLARYALLRLGEDDYQFVWTYHAILLDGWSTAMVMRDLVRHGAASRAGEVMPPPDRAPYRDFVEWTRLRDQDDARRHWREALRGFTKPTPLPVAGPGGSGGRTGVAEHTAGLSPEETERVGAAARTYRVPIGVMVQAAWALTLMRYAGVGDVVFGQVVSGRSGDLPGVQDMVGLLTNTVPVRVASGPGDRVGTWLRGLHARQSAALEYEHTPLSQVQRCSELPAGQELFQSVLVVQNYPRLDETGQLDPGYRYSGLSGFETTHYPITMFAVPGERLEIRAVHDLALVDGGTAALLAESVLTALTGLSADADRPVSTVPVFPTETAAHRRRDQVNATERRFSPPHTVAELIEEQVRRTPDATAVVDGDARLSYRELDRRADRLARTLVEQGARGEERVAVLLERSVSFVTAALAVLKSGAAYVPIDPGYPAARIAWMIEDSGCRTVLTRSDLLDRLPADRGETVRTVCLDTLPADGGAGGGGPERPLPARALPGNLAYVIYTSGSTGTPKGVMVSHRAVLNTMRWLEEELGCGPGDVVAFKTPVSFTDSVCEVVWPLCNGAALAVVGDETVRDPDALYDALDRHDVTYCQFVPRQLDLFMAAAAKRGTDDPLPRLRRVFNGGEPLPHSFAVEWDRRFRNGRIANIYGMTESAIYATYQALPRGFAERRGAVPIGLPIANTRVHVLNRELEPCPPGVVGELFVGGAGVARGYLGRPGLTAERFVPDVFGGSGGCLYRTGDLVRWSVDGGGLEFVGRVDFQVKVRGFRVELGEVESVLVGHRGVRDAVVVARSDGGGGVVRLVAYVVASGVGGEVGVEELRGFVGGRLPEYMVPAVFVWLGSLPLTVNGKVDRGALPVPEGERPRLGERFVEPRSSAERVLAEVWGEVLGVSRIGVHDNFFALGGDSLMAVRAVGRIREAFPADYTLPELFAAPTIAGCAATVERLLSEAADLDALMDEVAGLSDEEVAARLAEGEKSHE
ncbi:amino acid adenylation domain-containing protein [Actinomadura luteofluorescens]|uniref:amino acid adenylation domain-containing protein n=1 Tax=Actinomadura luteofluorescens TaxID=46163 RepID=UPI0030D40088